MLQLLLIFIAVVGVVRSEPFCPIFSALKNDISLFEELNGTFYKIVTLGTLNVANCQKQMFTIGPNNNITGYFQSPDWCLHLNNCDTSNSSYYQCDLTPISSGLASLPSTQRNSIKLAKKIGTGDNLCLVYSYCRIGEEGLYVLCRKPPRILTTVILAVINLLRSVLGLLAPIPVMKIVNQSGCSFSNSCPP